MSLSTKLTWELAQTKWAGELNPVLANPLLAGRLVTNIALVSGTPLSVNHLLGRMPNGWLLTSNTANSVVWTSEPFNSKSFIFQCSADTIIAIWAF